MDDFNKYVPGQAYANLKDEMAQEFTLGPSRLPTGTTTYKSGAKSTTTETPYGYNLEMRGPKKAVQPPAVTTSERFTDATEAFFRRADEQVKDHDDYEDRVNPSPGESFIDGMADMAEEDPSDEEGLPFSGGEISSMEYRRALDNPPVLLDDEDYEDDGEYLAEMPQDDGEYQEYQEEMPR